MSLAPLTVAHHHTCAAASCRARRSLDVIDVGEATFLYKTCCRRASHDPGGRSLPAATQAVSGETRSVSKRTNDFFLHRLRLPLILPDGGSAHVAWARIA